MGVQLIHRARFQQIKMKSLLVFAVVVIAVNCEPEADPALLLPGFGYGYPVVYGHPYSLGLGCFNDAGESVPCAGRKRREAEAALLYGFGYPYGGYVHPYTAGFGCHNVAGVP